MIFDEEFLTDLNENLPYKLLKAYQNTRSRDSKIKSTTFVRNPDSQHYELADVNNNKRRFATYDYGKAEYRKLTADEAENQLRRGQIVVDDLRVVIKLGENYEVAEWQAKNGNSIYNTYVAYVPDRILNNPAAESIRGKIQQDSQQNSTKFIQSINALCTFLHALGDEDAIYWTDEYQHKLSDAQIAARNEKNKVSISQRFKGNDEPSYLAHQPGKNIQNDIVPNVLDTGRHVPPRTFYLDQNWEAYYAALQAKRNTFKKFSFNRHAYNSLIRNRDLYDEDEFKEAEEIAKEKLDSSYNTYLEANFAYKKAKTKVITDVGDKIIALKQFSRPVTFTDPNTGNTITASREEYLEDYLQKYLNDIFNATERSNTMQKELGDLSSTDLTQQIKEKEKILQRETDRINSTLLEIETNLKELGIDPNASDLKTTIENLVNRSLSEEIHNQLVALMNSLAEVEEKAMEDKFKRIEQLTLEINGLFDKLETVSLNDRRRQNRLAKAQAKRDWEDKKLNDPKVQDILSVFNFKQANSEDSAE